VKLGSIRDIHSMLMNAPALAEAEPAFRGLDVAVVHAEQADFVWRSLQRLGVARSDLEDVFQEVFIVVQRRGHTFDTSSKLTTWLFGICLRVAAAHRRREWYRRLAPIARQNEERPAPLSEHPDAVLVQREALSALEQALNKMDLIRRAVFVMYELDELSTEEIAQMLDVPVGTVHSRLHSARKQFQSIVTKMKLREGGR
jgi:RNA polymerase sigma-70 factor (ECF subfamily)